MHKLEPNISNFWYIFKFFDTLKSQGWVTIKYQNSDHSCFIFGTSPDLIPYWKVGLFYVYTVG